MLAGVWGILISSCSGFLDTAPNDALDPSNTWKTEQDAEKFLVGCYDDWIDEKVSTIGIAPLISDTAISCGTTTRA